MVKGWMRFADWRPDDASQSGRLSLGRNRHRPQQSTAEQSAAAALAEERACLQLRVRAPLRPPPNGPSRGERKLRGSSSVAAEQLLPAARAAAASCKELGAPNTPTLFRPFPAHPPSLSRDALTTETRLLVALFPASAKTDVRSHNALHSKPTPSRSNLARPAATASTRLSGRLRRGK